MRTKVTLVLIFLNVALFFFIFKFERSWRTEAAALEARRRVLGPEAADIRTLKIKSVAPGGSFRVERKRDAWFLTEPLEWPANPHAISGIVHELQLLEHETSFRVADLAQTKQSLADYGLESPKLTVTFASGDPAAVDPAAPRVTVLAIGDTTKDGKRLYLLSPGGDRIHVVSRALLDSLTLPLEQIRADTLFTIPVFEARSLSLQTASPDQNRGGAAAGVRVRLRRDGARWKFETPIIAPASKTAIDLTISELNGLHARSFPPAPAVLPSAAPVVRIMIEGNSRHETLFLGEAVAAGPPPADRQPSDDPPKEGATPLPRPPEPHGAAASSAPAETEYYAQLEDRPALFTVVVPARLIETLRTAQESLREKRILDFDGRAVTAITLAAPVQSNVPPLTLQRLEPAAGSPSDATVRWQIVRRGEGTQGPQTLSADRETVQRLLDQLTLLAAEKFKSDAPTSADLENWGFNRPAREITLTFAGSAPPIMLRLGTDAGQNVYARVGTPADPGSSIFAVILDIRRELSLTAEAWRERTLREPLPATARISSLKLTDLGSKQTLFETAFDTSGAPATPPRDPKAVETVLKALRHLRAKNILPGGFTDKVVAGGDERPWRFQLDATIVLPGGAGTDQTGVTTLFLTERVGGAQQYAGSKEFDAVFEIDQEFLDAFWQLAYGARDPGPPPAPATKP